MFDMEFDQRALGLPAPRKIADVKLHLESTKIHVHVEHAEGCRWNCPQCNRELARYGHAPER